MRFLTIQCISFHSLNFFTLVIFNIKHRINFYILGMISKLNNHFNKNIKYIIIQIKKNVKIC